MKSHEDKIIFICIQYLDKSGTKMDPRREKEERPSKKKKPNKQTNKQTKKQFGQGLYQAWLEPISAPAESFLTYFKFLDI